ncbi:hypothetical protein AVEN_180922-1 [Araneus ventricosus]|uniref:Uncharacterized protein n=1 Tax=Araneus ventricosus TaxID=182803 RepID=A0A4Y2IYT4_ARAVE|nr:hypothetical protein AVEN_180922-1 [Araneus ventricosus]
MPTTKLNLEQPSPQVVTNGSALLNSANGLSHTENHLPTVSTNASTSNGTHEGHASPVGDDTFSYSAESDPTPLPAKVNSVPTCDSDLAGTSCKFLDGAGFTNGDIPSDSKTPSHHNGLASDRDLNSVLSDSKSSSGHNSSPRTKSPDLRVRFSEGGHIPPAAQVSDNHVVSSCEPVPCGKDSSGATSCDSPTEGATGGNPTLWLGDDQMLLLPGKSHSEETDSNSGTSETKSFEGLLSPNGTSILWDEDTDWILLFDNMIRYADRKQQRTTRSCGCRGELACKYYGYSYIWCWTCLTL